MNTRRLASGPGAAIVAALMALALVVAPVSAACPGPNPCTSNMTLTVVASTTITGAPPTIAFPDAGAGDTSTASPFTLTYSTNGASMTVVATSTALTSGANSIPNANVHLTFDATDHTLGSTVTIASGAGGSKVITPSVVVPANQPSGSYTGTLTITAS